MLPLGTEKKFLQTNFMEQSPSEANGAQLNSSTFMEPQGSLHCSQELACRVCPEIKSQHTAFNLISSRLILIVSSHLLLGLQNGV